MKNSKKKLHNNTLISALIIGILGSALWEKVFSPFSAFIFSNISSFASRYMKGWNDNLYRGISNGFYDERLHLILVFLIAVIVFIVGPKLFRDTFYYFNFCNNDFEEDDNHHQEPPANEEVGMPSHIKIFIFDLVTCIMYILIISLPLSYMVGKATFIEATKNRTLSNIEIVAPCIDNSEYKMLKSNFFSMECEDDYKTLSKKLSDIAKENHLKLK